MPCAPESGKVDFIDCDSPVDLMRMLVEQHGGGPVSINRLCKVRMIVGWWIYRTRSSITPGFE